MTKPLSPARTELVQAYIDGKDLEYSYGICFGWTKVDSLHVLANAMHEGAAVRIKPETRSINGVEFAAPDGIGEYAIYIAATDRKGGSWHWSTKEDRDAAIDAICNALNGVTK